MEPNLAQNLSFWKHPKQFLGELKQHSLLIIELSILLIGLLVGLYLIKNPTFLNPKAAVGNASISLLYSFAAKPNEVFQVPVMINTDGKNIVAADVVITFDPAFLQLQKISPKPASSTLKTFMPADNSGNFKEAEVTNNANRTGRIEFGILTYAGITKTAPFNGQLSGANPLASLSFQALKEGTTSVNFVFTPDQTTDSNLVNTDGVDVLAKVTNMGVIITSPTPAPTEIPVATSTPIAACADLGPGSACRTADYCSSMDGINLGPANCTKKDASFICCKIPPAGTVFTCDGKGPNVSCQTESSCSQAGGKSVGSADCATRDPSLICCKTPLSPGTEKSSTNRFDTGSGSSSVRIP